MFGKYDNVTAEATGRVLAVRLYNMTVDPGMNSMLLLFNESMPLQLLQRHALCAREFLPPFLIRPIEQPPVRCCLRLHCGDSVLIWTHATVPAFYLWIHVQYWFLNVE
jgi:hypothetical protein